MCIVRLLLSWCRQQTMQVKWGTNYLSFFTVTNGVRQGGVLSPYLCAVYLDELSIQLGSARVGCTVGNIVVNHLKFADDICVFSPTINGLYCATNKLRGTFDQCSPAVKNTYFVPITCQCMLANCGANTRRLV